jgi:hypothetical protein
MTKQKKTVAQPDLRVYKEVEKVKQQLSVYERLKQFFNQFNIF